MAVLAAHALVQPAVVVHDLDAGVDRMHELFLAVPSERNDTREFANAVYAFGNNTYLELLDGRYEEHTRARFLRQFGAGMYMFCIDIERAEPAAVEAELERAGVRVVAPGRATENITAGWHLHPRDCGGLLVLHAMKRDLTDNTDWAGHKCQAYVPGNTRVIAELRGVIARTPNPAGEAHRYGDLGLPMEPLSSAGAFRWRGPTGTLFELWPADAWPGESVDSHRDYALCLPSTEPEAAIARLNRAGLDFVPAMLPGRLLSSIDPVLGVRFLIEPR
jgi:hypothetical protein